MLNNQKFKLVQYGLFPFIKINAAQNNQTNVKTKLDESQYFDGKVKTNQMSLDFKDDEVYQIDFWVDKETDLHSLRKLVYGEPQKVFFIEEYDRKIWIGKNTNGETRYNVYFNYAHIISHPIFITSESLDEGGNEYDKYTMQVRLMTPYKYLIQNNLSFIPIENLPKIKNSLWGAYYQQWGGSGNWGDYISDNAIDIMNLSEIDKTKLLSNLKKCCYPNGLFIYIDYWFARETKNLIPESGLIQNRDRIKTFTLKTGEAFNTFYTLNTASYANQQNIESNNGLNLITTSENYVNVIEIESLNNTNNNTSALLLNQEISFENKYTSTGFKIKWLSSTIPCPKKLSIFTHLQDGLFDSITGNYLNPFEGQYKGCFSLDFLENVKGNFLLSFRGLYPINENFTIENSDLININRNFDNSVNRILKLTFCNLPVFH